jgi:hypothetical protein
MHAKQMHARELRKHFRGERRPPGAVQREFALLSIGILRMVTDLRPEFRDVNVIFFCALGMNAGS